jgi:spermidine synthase
MSSTGGRPRSASIEDQRAKSSLVYKEDIFPGLRFEAELKALLALKQSKFQKVEVIETFFGRTLITDGKTQSAEFDEHAYHESLVHPAMLQVASQTPPRTIFIGGGGELATAREVLKYTCVERLVMVDLDETVVTICQEYLPEWGGSTTTDPRFELIIGDAHEYILNSSDKYDVIIMDISDPIEAGPGICLYTKEFYEIAKTKLTQHGVLVTQSGMAESIPTAMAYHTPPTHVDPSCFTPIHNTLSSAFDTVVPYTTHIPSFGCDWGYNLAYSGPPNAIFVNQLIEQYIQGAHDSLRFYDETTHCRMFALTKPLRMFMAQDDRIITKDDPIFMY